MEKMKRISTRQKSGEWVAKLEGAKRVGVN